MGNYKYNTKSFYYSVQKGEKLDTLAYRDLPDEAKSSFLKFDSYHEYRVYLSLVGYVPFNRIKKDRPITLNCGFGPHFETRYPYRITWKPDFTVVDRAGFPLGIVEAKGAVTRTFPLVLKLFISQYPDLAETTWIVFQGQPELLSLKPVKPIKVDAYTRLLPAIVEQMESKKDG